MQKALPMPDSAFCFVEESIQADDISAILLIAARVARDPCSAAAATVGAGAPLAIAARPARLDAAHLECRFFESLSGPAIREALQ